MIYLLHFSRPLHHAQHYLGTCEDGRLPERLQEHGSGRGARLMEVIVQQGITFECVRTWKGGRKKERALKRRHNGRRLCPLCGPPRQRSGGPT